MRRGKPRAPLSAQARVWQVGSDLECFRFPRASPAPAPPRPAARGRARACERGRVGKDRRRDPVASLALPPPPWPPAPTRSARLSHDQGDPHLQQPREAAALQVLPALREYSAAADQGEGGVVGCRQRPQGDPLRRAAALLAPRPPRGPGLSASGVDVSKVLTSRRAPILRRGSS